jgi:hypothetical protein
MADVQKSSDAMLDVISTMRANRDECKALMDMYMEGGLLMPQVASHLWEVLNGLRTEPANEEAGSVGDHPARV